MKNKKAEAAVREFKRKMAGLKARQQAVLKKYALNKSRAGLEAARKNIKSI